jgi:hypothetical protein
MSFRGIPLLIPRLLSTGITNYQIKSPRYANKSAISSSRAWNDSVRNLTHQCQTGLLLTELRDIHDAHAAVMLGHILTSCSASDGTWKASHLYILETAAKCRRNLQNKAHIGKELTSGGRSSAFSIGQNPQGTPIVHGKLQSRIGVRRSSFFGKIQFF